MAWNCPSDHLPSYTKSLILHIISVFSNPVLGTQDWRSTCTLCLWKVSFLSFRFTMLLLWDSCCFSLHLFAPIFIPSSHLSPMWKAFPPRGLATYNTCSASRHTVLPASHPLLSLLAPSLSLGIVFFSFFFFLNQSWSPNIYQMTDSVPREAFLSLATPAPSRQLFKVSRASLEGKQYLDIRHSLWM